MHRRRAYATLLLEDSYFYGVAALIRSLVKTGTTYPLLLLHTPNVASATLHAIKQMIRAPRRGRGSNCRSNNVQGTKTTSRSTSSDSSTGHYKSSRCTLLCPVSHSSSNNKNASNSCRPNFYGEGAGVKGSDNLENNTSERVGQDSGPNICNSSDCSCGSCFPSSCSSYRCCCCCLRGGSSAEKCECCRNYYSSERTAVRVNNRRSSNNGKNNNNDSNTASERSARSSATVSDGSSSRNNNNCSNNRSSSSSNYNSKSSSETTNESSSTRTQRRNDGATRDICSDGATTDRSAGRTGAQSCCYYYNSSSSSSQTTSHTCCSRHIHSECRSSLNDNNWSSCSNSSGTNSSSSSVQTNNSSSNSSPNQKSSNSSSQGRSNSSHGSSNSMKERNSSGSSSGTSADLIGSQENEEEKQEVSTTAMRDDGSPSYFDIIFRCVAELRGSSGNSSSSTEIFTDIEDAVAATMKQSLEVAGTRKGEREATGRREAAETAAVQAPEAPSELTTIPKHSVKQILKVADGATQERDVNKKTVRRNKLNSSTSCTWDRLYTKLRLWEQDDFEVIVYIDADCIVLQNVDELFDRLDSPSDNSMLHMGCSCYYCCQRGFSSCRCCCGVSGSSTINDCYNKHCNEIRRRRASGCSTTCGCSYVSDQHTHCNSRSSDSVNGNNSGSSNDSVSGLNNSCCWWWWYHYSNKSEFGSDRGGYPYCGCGCVCCSSPEEEKYRPAFAADVFPPDRFNAGVIVLKPNKHLYLRLLHASGLTSIVSTGEGHTNNLSAFTTTSLQHSSIEQKPLRQEQQQPIENYQQIPRDMQQQYNSNSCLQQKLNTEESWKLTHRKGTGESLQPQGRYMRSPQQQHQLQDVVLKEGKEKKEEEEKVKGKQNIHQNDTDETQQQQQQQQQVDMIARQEKTRFMEHVRNDASPTLQKQQQQRVNKQVQQQQQQQQGRGEHQQQQLQQQQELRKQHHQQQQQGLKAHQQQQRQQQQQQQELREHEQQQQEEQHGLKEQQQRQQEKWSEQPIRNKHMLISYDGGDTGLLNAFFPDWYTWPSRYRLPFKYNAQRSVYRFTGAAHADENKGNQRNSNSIWAVFLTNGSGGGQENTGGGQESTGPVSSVGATKSPDSSTSDNSTCSSSSTTRRCCRSNSYSSISYHCCSCSKSSNTESNSSSISGDVCGCSTTRTKSHSTSRSSHEDFGSSGSGDSPSRDNGDDATYSSSGSSRDKTSKGPEKEESTYNISKSVDSNYSNVTDRRGGNDSRTQCNNAILKKRRKRSTSSSLAHGNKEVYSPPSNSDSSSPDIDQKNVSTRKRGSRGYWEAIGDIKILHFTSSPKPWERPPGTETELEDLWWNFFMGTDDIYTRMQSH